MTINAGGLPLEDIRKTFLTNKRKQLEMANQHEQSEKFGVAYLAIWYVFESFSKEIAPVCQRAELVGELDAWLCFLSGKTNQKPKIISSSKFNIEKCKTEKIPQEYLLKILINYDSASEFYEIIDPGKKYRKRRNAIAHSGEEPSRSVYAEFSMKALRAINEIETWLENRTV